jgi:hypothetical protein
MKPSGLSRVASTAGEASEEDKLVFLDSFVGKPLAIADPLLEPCNPEIVVQPSGTVQWELGVFSLDVMLTCGWPGITAKYYRHGAARETDKLVLPAIDASSLYCRSDGEPLFIAEGTESGDGAGTSAGKAPTASSTTTVECELCMRSINLKDMRGHMGAHLLEKEWTKYKKPKPDFPCMLCGVRTSIGQYMTDPLSLEGNCCTVSIKKGSGGTLKPVHRCKLVGSEYDYSLKAAVNSVLSAPCTNRVRCPAPLSHRALVLGVARPLAPNSCPVASVGVASAREVPVPLLRACDPVIVDGRALQ